MKSRSWCLAARALVLVAATLIVRPTLATEPKSDLSLELRVVETTESKGGLGRPSSGVVRIEVRLDAFRDASEVALSIEDVGAPEPLVRSNPRLAGSLDWISVRGERLVPGARGIVIPARGRILTRLDVPLSGSAVHEIKVRATALNDGREVSTEAVVFVPVDAPGMVADEKDGIANFSLGVK